MPNIIELAAEANRMHARVSSICQLNEGWQANLVPTRHFQGDHVRNIFGRADTPEAALEDAVALLRKVDDPATPAPAPAVDAIEDVLG